MGAEFSSFGRTARFGRYPVACRSWKRLSGCARNAHRPVRTPGYLALGDRHGRSAITASTHDFLLRRSDDSRVQDRLLNWKLGAIPVRIENTAHLAILSRKVGRRPLP